MKSKISCWRFVRSMAGTASTGRVGRTCVRKGNRPSDGMGKCPWKARAKGPPGVPAAIVRARSRAGGGIGRRARLRALWGDSPVEVRVLFGALERPCVAGPFSILRRDVEAVRDICGNSSGNRCCCHETSPEARMDNDAKKADPGTQGSISRYDTKKGPRSGFFFRDADGRQSQRRGFRTRREAKHARERLMGEVHGRR